MNMSTVLKETLQPTHQLVTVLARSKLYAQVPEFVEQRPKHHCCACEGAGVAAAMSMQQQEDMPVYRPYHQRLQPLGLDSTLAAGFQTSLASARITSVVFQQQRGATPPPSRQALADYPPLQSTGTGQPQQSLLRPGRHQHHHLLLLPLLLLCAPGWGAATHQSLQHDAHQPWPARP